MRCKKRVLVNNSLSKKILSFYVIVSMLITFSGFYVVAPTNVDVQFPIDDNYYTNNTYVTVNISVTGTTYDNSSFIDWNNSLVGYWSFEYTNGTHVIDGLNYSNYNNATCVGRNSSDNLTTGKFGSGLYFNGSSDQYLNCGNHSSLDLSSNNFTIELWIKEFEASFNRTFGNASFDRGHSVQQTSDGGYILLGEVDVDDLSSPTMGNITLIKTNSYGDEEWRNYFGGNGSNRGEEVQQTSDGGYIITGRKWNDTNYNLWLIKTDASGLTQWEYNWSTGGDDKGYSVKQTSDGGYIITGEKSNGSYSDLWLIKANESGIEEWNNTFDSMELDDGGYFVLETNDGYMVTGYTNYGGTRDWELWALNISSDGQTINNEYIDFGDGDYYDWGVEIQQTTDGGFIITGTTFAHAAPADAGNAWLVKLNSTGDYVTYGNYSIGLIDTYTDGGKSGQQTRDGGYILTGYWDSPGIDYGDTSGGLLLLKTNSTLNETWTQVFGTRHDGRIGRSVQQASDGGYVILGDINVSDTDKQINLIKTNIFGNITESNNNQSLNKTLVGKGRDAYQIELNNGTIYGYIDGIYINSTQFDLYDLAQQWNHIVLTYNGSEIGLYINGTLVNSTAYNDAIDFNEYNLTIGKNFSGIIDEVRIWNRSLSQEEISASYNCSGYLENNFTGLSEGNYSYYAFAIDTEGNNYTTATRNVTVDYTAPTSNVTQIIPYNQSDENITINATAIETLSGLNNTKLYYYNSTNNFSWSGPHLYYEVDNTPWIDTEDIGWSFNFSLANGTNYYRFYSIATDNASNTEEIAESDFDTSCYYNYSLNIPPHAATNESPTNESTSVSITTDLSWDYAGDPDGDDSANATYDVYFATSSPPAKVSTTQSSNTYDVGTLSYGTTYYWMIITYDNHSIGTKSGVWWFTTETSGNGGNGGGTQTTNNPPTADAGGPYTGYYVNQTIKFDGSNSDDSDGSITSWAWNFGDGNTGSGETINHSYTSAGNYTVTLTVTDNEGTTDQDTESVKISEVPLVNLPPEITNVEHIPDSVKSNDNVTITAYVIDPDGIDSVKLHYDKGSGEIVIFMEYISGNKYSAEIGPFSKGTKINYWLLAKDKNTNPKTNRSETYSFIVQALPITEEIGNISEGEEKEVNISYGNIRQVTIKSIAKLENVTLQIKERFSEEFSEEIRYNVSGQEVYKYYDFELSSNETQINETDIESAKINFTVEKSWIEENKIDNQTIILLRYFNNTWQNLTTNLLDIDNETYLFYEAETPGFSTFALVGSKVIEKEQEWPDEPQIPWTIIIGFIISAIVILLIVLIKAKYIYIEEVDAPDKE